MGPGIFIDSNGTQWQLCYGICKCYVWLNVVINWGSKNGGKCGRCNTRVKNLNIAATKYDALAIFKDAHGRLPEPMTRN